MTETPQLGLFATTREHPVVDRLRLIDANQLTPLEALALIAELSVESRVDEVPIARPGRDG